MRIFLVCICFAIVCSAASGAPVPRRLAALDVADPLGVFSGAESSLLGDTMRASARAALPADSYIIMTRDNIFELIPPDVSLGECGGDCAIETGRNLGARHILTADLAAVGSGYRVTISLYDTETANLLGTAKAVGGNIVELEVALSGETTRLLMILPGAAPDQVGIRAEAERRRRSGIRSRNRTNRLLTIGAGLAGGAAAYFHAAADGAYDDHLAATSSTEAAATWDDYEKGMSRRDLALGVTGGLVLWRLVRVFGGTPTTEEIRQDLIEKRRLETSTRLGHPSDRVVWACRVGF